MLFKAVLVQWCSGKHHIKVSHVFLWGNMRWSKTEMSLGSYDHLLQPYCQIRSLWRVARWPQTPVFSLSRLRLHGNQGSFITQCFEWVSWTKFLSELYCCWLNQQYWSNISSQREIIFLEEKALNNINYFSLPTQQKEAHLSFFILADRKMMWRHSCCLGNVVYGTCRSVKWGHLLLLVNAYTLTTNIKWWSTLYLKHAIHFLAPLFSLSKLRVTTCKQPEKFLVTTLTLSINMSNILIAR